MKPMKALLKGAGLWAKKNSPHILVGLGLAGMVGAIVTAVKATPKAKELIEQAEEEKGEKLTPAETVKTAWKCYILPAACFTTSAACIIGADIHNAKVNAGLASTAAIAETALRTYQEKVVETIGEQEEKKVREKAKTEIAEKPGLPNEAVYILGGEKVLCVDCLGNEFHATADDIRAGVNRVNERLNNDDYVSLNELYEEVNAPETIIGDYIGWNREKGLLEVHFSSDLKQGKPRLVVTYRRFDWFDYNKR